jgi:hypothetical protein
LVLAPAIAACLDAPQCPPTYGPPVAANPPVAPQGGTSLVCNGVHYWTDGGMGRNWEQARAFCRGMGGELASIHSDADMACAIRIVAPSGNLPHGAWIGLHEEQEEGNWRWSDGTPVNFIAWMKGEPSNDSGGPHDCGHLWREHEFQWNDIPCSATDIAFLCEIP